MTDPMRVALLHGVRDLRVETVPMPCPDRDEVLVQIETCGICPTDVRKYFMGTRDQVYPANLGHEWVGRVVALGSEVCEPSIGQRVYGDTFAGYAEFGVLRTKQSEWSAGAVTLPDDIPLERAVFVEPFADCLHAVLDQAMVARGHSVVVLGAGAMGIQLVAASVRAGARVLVVEPIGSRRELALEFGAEACIEPTGWGRVARDWCLDDGAEAVILSVGLSALAPDALDVVRPGGRIVLFGGFGNSAEASLDLNKIHYRELTVVGSEWIGLPPRQRYERYAEARDLLTTGDLKLEQLVTEVVGFEGIPKAMGQMQTHDSLKAVLRP